MHSDVHFGNQPKQRNAAETSVRKFVAIFFNPSYISLKCFFESSEKVFQIFWTYVYSHSTSNSTLLSLGKTAKKITKASRKFESEFWKVYSLLISESWLLTAWRAGSLEKRLLLSAWLLTSRFCLPSFASFLNLSLSSDFPSKSDSFLCFRWLIKPA